MKYLLAFFIASLLLLAGCNNKEENNNSNSAKSNSSSNSNNTSNYHTSSLSTPIPKEEVISSFSTPVNYPEETDRQTNMTLCCNTLNGTIVKAGTEFSFCDTVGQATPEKGYKEADIFDLDGNITTGYGGGKCQVSTTLYNAVLALPSLVVTERHPHTREVYYVEEGKDACISYGGADFKFRNDNSFDIKIYAVNNYNTIDVSIAKISY